MLERSCLIVCSFHIAASAIRVTVSSLLAIKSWVNANVDAARLGAICRCIREIDRSVPEDHLVRFWGEIEGLDGVGCTDDT